MPVDSELEWVQAAAVFLTVAYLSLEVFYTRQVTSAVFTESAAIVTMDYLSQAWKCHSTTWRLIEIPTWIAQRRPNP